MTIKTSLAELTTVDGLKIEEISHECPVLLVFLRHFGCTFCREALGDLAEQRREIEALGGQLVFVHMTDCDTALKYFGKYGLWGVHHVSDPQCHHYQGFGLTKGTARQLFGLHSWIRGFQAGLVEGHGVGSSPLGDGFQMPGVFVIIEGTVRSKFIHRLAGDRPQYVTLLSDCCGTSN